MAVLKATARGATGSRDAKHLREQGKIPGIIYGHGLPNVPIVLDEHDVDVAIHHGERLFQLELDGVSEDVLIKDVQWDTFGQIVLHVDLARVSMDERVEVTVSLAMHGTPAGAAEGGVLQQNLTEVNIECTVRDMPEEVQVRISDLNIGDSLHLKDIELPAGSKLLDDPEQLVCSVSVVTEVEEAPAEEGEGADEPEVIGAKDEAEEDEGA